MFEKEFEKYGLTAETYEKVLNEIDNKMSGVSDLDWSEIVDKYDIKCHYDSLRKASQTIFGNYFVREYLKTKDSSPTSISDLKNVLDEQYIVRQQIRNDKNALNRMKRELVPCLTVAEDMRQFMIDNNLRVSIPEYCKDTVMDVSEKVMVCPISDWHIGVVINNCEGNYYNWRIANERLNEYIKKCLEYIDLYRITKVIVVNCGDTIEHTYMRPTQQKDCEFPQAEQINRAIKMIYRFIIALSQKCNVVYGGLAGNHDRMNGDKKKSFEGDNANVIINEQLKTYAELSDNNRLSFIDTKYNDGEIRMDINGVKFKFVHGDNLPRINSNTMADTISSDNEFYDCLVYGHWHNFMCQSENNGRYIVANGCLSGKNTYSKSFFCSTNASQTIIIVGNKEIEVIKDVNLE